ncbi:uncharacterized protein BDR25DRAFT_354465 [Lindgomyces ingoldianus]|uniref:Uncharacterized protein n=1 Tax=Lindgomyces ingoldianus TaxID=673940 RepID=A0ACB6QWA0_9PLEO|nr:uncharacterized protein BDR25DRAFT_354465 [Lindgomyces ingoldianus]KAF2471211.1 hypothetical protein BDR25DRAFT_354465 [Lindgomyces ingoldianus]
MRELNADSQFERIQRRRPVVIQGSFTFSIPSENLEDERNPNSTHFPNQFTNIDVLISRVQGLCLDCIKSNILLEMAQDVLSSTARQDFNCFERTIHFSNHDTSPKIYDTTNVKYFVDRDIAWSFRSLVSGWISNSLGATDDSFKFGILTALPDSQSVSKDYSFYYRVRR